MATIQLKRGLSTSWTTQNPTLAAGECGYETNTGKMKIGNGSTAWNTLGYFTGGLIDSATGKIATSYIPSLAIGEAFTVATQAAMLALTAQKGDIAIRTDESKTYILQGDDPTVIGNWVQILFPGTTDIDGGSIDPTT